MATKRAPAEKTRKLITVERKEEFKISLPSGHVEILTFDEADTLCNAIGGEI